MGSKYPVLSPSEVIAALSRLGFTFKSQRGSHAKYVFEMRTVISHPGATRTRFARRIATRLLRWPR